ncbi:hypothetical protein WA1_23085 [Scytonema hofmannii PCC 7110]|uniref:Uncharacterized protein n=1 Tax=Scytonema hofmannii PCC 7110 TaxID=128403 RepID=A0A139X8N5_9CYAN|nr:hypothetical protein [Scytonema hofmannii]KYC41015.1 hypothetical protein WA1_23085 [Scytonema hofmannii PCC 7110]
MKNFSIFLQDIKDNPVIYLGKPSITCLHSLLVGYLTTLRHLGFLQEGCPMDGFQEWIQERGKTTVSQSWAKIILFNSMDEYEALERFFELFEEYLNRNKSSNQVS